MGLEFKPYNPGDEKKIVLLFEKVFGRTMGKTESEQHWRWEFISNPVKPVSIMLAWDGKRLVAQYAVNPLRAWVQANELPAALSLDTMTDAEYRGRSIFLETAQSLYNEIASKGISFVFGFPNAESIHSFSKRLNWDIICSPPIYICPLDAGSFVKNKSEFELLGALASKVSKKLLTIPHKFISENYHGEIVIHKENSFDKWADELWLKCSAQHKLWVVRDYEYLSWRYDMRPESEYNLFTAWKKDEIVGYIVTTSRTRNEGKISFILDILADIKLRGAVHALLKAVIRASIEAKDSMISAVIMPGSVYRIALRKHFFISLPQKFLPQEIYFGGRRLNNQIPAEIFCDPNSWQISWGDTDLL